MDPCRIAIVIATYQRPDGKTPSLLCRALDSIYKQSMHNYQVYLIGDKYEDNKEFRNITSEYPFIKYLNLDTAAEREKYPFGDERLWSSGGVNASHFGIDWAIRDGIEYVCHLDHDDWWEPDHLKSICRAMDRNPIFICTLSTYRDKILPVHAPTGDIILWYPLPGGVICSSVCIKYSATNLRARDCYAETGKAFPADADLWMRLSDEMRTTGRRGYVVASLTCHHDDEGYAATAVSLRSRD